MSCPAKFREIGDFHEYYSGSRKAPYLTIFVGGNHEASSHLWELSYGGWVAPNIFYMGAANIVRLGPVRISGMSGIWKGYNYNKPHHERLPYNQDDIKTIYHIREIDVRKMLQVRTQVDIGISHDWPRAIERHGNERSLFNLKPDFEKESNDGTLGNLAAAYVMDRLRPPYWFAAHMHCKFSALKTYENDVDVAKPFSLDVMPNGAIQDPVVAEGTGVVTQNDDEINLDMDEDDQPVTQIMSTPVAAAQTQIVPEDIRALLPASFARPAPHVRRLPPGQPPPATITNKSVRFLALDKCLPGRKFLQLLDVLPASLPTTTSPSPSASNPRYRLCYDPEWLAITRVFAPSVVLGDRNVKNPPDLGEAEYLPLIQAEEAWVNEHIVRAGKLEIPENFQITAPVHVPGMPEKLQEGPREYNNPQMDAFCQLIGIENKFYATEEERLARESAGPAPEEPRRDGGFGGGRGSGRGGRGGRGGGFGRGRGGRGGRGRGRGW
jgi:lariat debranching enzyme